MEGNEKNIEIKDESGLSSGAGISKENENNYISNSQGLTNDEGNEGGDFVGSGKMDEEINTGSPVNYNSNQTGNGLSTEEADEGGDFSEIGNIKKNKIKEPPRNSSANTLYPTDINEIDTGTTGTNKKKDRNLEK